MSGTADFWDSGWRSSEEIPMSESGRPGDPTGPDTRAADAADRRERLSAQVRQCCAHCRIDGHLPPLSDLAAVTVAAGRLDESVRAVVAARHRTGLSVPGSAALGDRRIGERGYGELRILTEEQRGAAARAARQRPGVARLVLDRRAGDLARRIDAARQAFVHSTRHYAQSVRAVRRARRDGTHLELAQRDALFAALQATPAPLPDATLDRVRASALGVARDRTVRWSQNTPAAELGRRAADALTSRMPEDDDRFADRYDTLLFLAGSLHDRILASRVWGSDHLAVQRAQLDVTDELMQIATDTAALRELMAELADAMRMAPQARSGLESRIAALGPVWEQLQGRVAALARIGDLLGRADARMRMVEVAERTAGLDERIDELIGRSGIRELSTDNANAVGDQFDDVTSSIGMLQAALHTDIAELTSQE